MKIAIYDINAFPCTELIPLLVDEHELHAGGRMNSRTTSILGPVLNRIELLSGDTPVECVRDFEGLKPDAILFGMPPCTWDELNPPEAGTVNLGPTMRYVADVSTVLSRLSAAGLDARCVIFSTGEVYRSSSYPFTVLDDIGMISSPLAFLCYAQEFSGVWGKGYNICRLRLFEPYSEHGHCYGMVGKMVLEIERNRTVPGVESNAILAPTHMQDIARVTNAAIRIAHLPLDVYNVGFAAGCSIARIVQLLSQAYGVPTRKLDGTTILSNWIPAVDQLARDFGYTPAISFERGVEMISALGGQ